jgi:hypothetical protein
MIAGMKHAMRLAGAAALLAVFNCCDKSPQATAVVNSPVPMKVSDFLDSLGACVHVQHHQDASKLVEPLKYTGIRAVRDGADRNYDVTGLLLLHQRAGVMVCFGPGSGANNESLRKTLDCCRTLATAGALLAIEGPNEPNNFGGVTYQGKNSSKLSSWLPVAHYQSDLYKAVKSDPLLKTYPVYGVSESGAEDDNAGLQFITIPQNAGTLMPDGTQFCDYINCHNYVCGHIKGLVDNQATYAAAVKPPVAIDHLFGNHGKTWRKHFIGYTEAELATLPKVTTETGWVTDQTLAGDDRQGKVLINTFLAQFKAGWSHTFIYEFADDADGAFGFYKSDLTTPRGSAHYLHNLTTILTNNSGTAVVGIPKYSIANQPSTVHDLLLQNSGRTFDLIIWGERVNGSDKVIVNFAEPQAVVKVFDPTVRIASMTNLTSARSIDLTLSDHALIVELSR